MVGISQHQQLEFSQRKTNEVGVMWILVEEVFNFSSATCIVTRSKARFFLFGFCVSTRSGAGLRLIRDYAAGSDRRLF